MTGLGMVACDGETPDPDGGDLTPDAGPAPDRTRPTLLSTSPAEGASGVARATVFEATFSEAVVAGTVRVAVEGEDLVLDPEVDGARLRIFLTDGWPPSSEVEVRIDDDLTDLAGNRLDRPAVVRFTTADDVAPEVVATTPGEGGDDISARLTAIRVRFSEPMDQAAGTLTLEGGSAALVDEDPVWSASEVVVGVTGLTNDTAYRLVLAGFQDRDGNPFDPAPVLEDGALDFTTRPDDEAPQLVASTPNEGQVDVLVESLAGSITLEFDEAMDTSIVSAPLSVGGGADQDVVVTWDDALHARVAISGVTQTEATHALDLTGMRDAAGNALAPGPGLGDGVLDFTTGVDLFVPYVAASSPVEGATDAPLPFAGVELAFSEAMDTALAEVTLTDDLGRTSMAIGTWGAGGTVLAIDAGAFVSGRTYQVGLSGLADLSGTSVSTADEYLVDGVLDFSIARPTGESCATPLLIEHADSVAAGRALFEITREQRTRNNGSGVCDPNGIAETDAVILYRKTTPALGSPGGAALRVMTFDVSNRVNVDVLSGVCDPRDATAAAARQVCMTGHDTVDQLLDVPAGDYYLWFSTADGSPFDIDVGIEEVESIPEGEACGDPYDTSSASYTAPGGPDEPHVWDLPAATNNSLDISRSNLPGAAISCDNEPFGDVVIQFDKAAADTVLDVQLLGASGGFAMEILHGACRADAGGVSAACDSFIGSANPERFSAAAPAGPVYIWLAGTSSSSFFRGARVEVRELPAPATAGSSCATAIPISPGSSVAVTPTHPGRYFAPSCLPAGSDVTWYAFDTTEGITQVRTVGEGVTALINAASGAESGCLDDATTEPLARFAPVGTRLCVAVESSSGVTGLDIASIAYDGPGLSPPTRLDIAPPNLEGSLFAGFPITGDDWLAATPTTLYQNMGTAGLIQAPVAGGTRASIRFDVDGRTMGRSALAIGEALYSLEQSSSGSRFFRFTNDAGVWDPEIMDPGADYPEHTYGLAHDGDAFFTIVREGSSSATRDFPIYQLATTSPAAPVVVGRVDTIYQTAGLAVTPSHFFMSGATSSSSSTRGIYRVARAALAADTITTPELILPLSTLGTLGTPMRVYTSPTQTYLYLRDSQGSIHVIGDPDGAARYLGVVIDTSNTDYAFDIEPTSGALYLFGTQEDFEGDWYRLDR
ncbi:MAG: Ig-like domain-containing protein [Sandaracinaceae bacterium]